MDEEFLRARVGNLKTFALVSQCLILTGFEANGSTRLGCACTLIAPQVRLRLCLQSPPCVVQMVRGEKRRPDNVVCCSCCVLLVLGAPEVWKAVPVQEYDSVLATGDFGAHLTTAAIKRKLTLLHRWLQKPLVVMLSVRINVTCR